MLLPAPFGPIRPRISPGRTSNERSSTATRPPNSLRARSTISSGAVPRGRARRGSAGAAATVARLRLAAAAPATARRRRACAATAGSSACRKRPARSCLRAPATEGSQLCSSCFSRRDQRRADDRAPDAAGAADDRHEQILDALVDAEWRRIDEALQVRIQPAGNAGQQSRRKRRPRSSAARVDAECFGHFQSALSARTARPDRESSRLSAVHRLTRTTTQIR